MMLGLIASSIYCFSWESDYTSPSVTSVSPVEGKREVEVRLDAVTGTEGADRLTLTLYED